MNSSVILETPADETDTEGHSVSELKRSIASCFAEIDQLRQQMRLDQMEIDRSRKRTHLLLAEIKTTLFPAGQKAD